MSEYINDKKRNLKMCIEIAAFWAVIFVLGSFYDEGFARFIYVGYKAGETGEPSIGMISAVVVSAVGSYIFYGSFVFLLGILARQIMNSVSNKLYNAFIAFVYLFFSLFTSTYGAMAIRSNSVCGLLMPNISNSLMNYVITGLILFIPLYPLGIAVNGRKCDDNVIDELMILLSILTVAIIFSNVVKGGVMRPRYRVTLQGYEGIGFVPWYRHIQNGKELIAAYALVRDDFSSFFSGHAMDGMLGIILFPAFRHVFEKLKGREMQLICLALIIAVPVTFSRLMLGNHYLSDVAVGGLVGVGMAAVHFTIVPLFSGKKGQ